MDLHTQRKLFDLESRCVYLERERDLYQRQAKAYADILIERAARKPPRYIFLDTEGALEQERDALAAHVERLRQSGNRALFFAGAERWKYKWSQAVEEGPKISLARRDALKQAEVLDRAAGTGGHMIDPRELRHQAAELRDEAAELRRKAENGE